MIHAPPATPARTVGPSYPFSSAPPRKGPIAATTPPAARNLRGAVCYTPPAPNFLRVLPFCGGWCRKYRHQANQLTLTLRDMHVSLTVHTLQASNLSHVSKCQRHTQLAHNDMQWSDKEAQKGHAGLKPRRMRTYRNQGCKGPCSNPAHAPAQCPSRILYSYPAVPVIKPRHDAAADFQYK